MTPKHAFRLEDLVRCELDGPPPHGFDCGSEAQNRFLYERAWVDQQEWISTTFLYYVDETLAAYYTACHDSIPLGTREKPRNVPYRYLGAIKLAQLGVDHRFSGMGLGAFTVAGMLAYAREQSANLRCRYATLDAQPHLVPWYAGQGFSINKVAQKERVSAAAGKRDPAEVPVSMRFDLRDPW